MPTTYQVTSTPTTIAVAGLTSAEVTNTGSDDVFLSPGKHRLRPGQSRIISPTESALTVTGSGSVSVATGAAVTSFQQRIAADSALKATYAPGGRGVWTPEFTWSDATRRTLPQPWQVRRVMASPPTVGTIASSQTVTAKAWYALTGGGGASATPDPAAPFTYLGAGSPTRVGSTNPLYNYVGMKSISNSGIESAPYSISFFFDGTTLELMVRNAASYGWEILVDGELTSATPVASSGAFIQGYIPITFATRAVRHIEVRTQLPFRGVTTGATDTVWAASARGPRCIIAGDSFTSGTGGTYTGLSGYVRTFADYMGWGDTWASGIGSTGWLAPGSTVKLGDRIAADIVAHSPDIVIVCMGGNDLSYVSTIQAEVTADLTAIRAGLPNLKKLIIVGPFRPGSTIASFATLQANVFAGAAGLADATIDTVTAPWFTGTGRSGATAGDGNSDNYITTDSVHPTDAGHAYLGRRLAHAVRGLMAA